MLSQNSILEILDQATEAFVFPMLDNGYIYPIVSRLRAFRAPGDWALVFETFGYPPRASLPDLCLTAIGTGLPKLKTVSDFVSQEAFNNFERLNEFWRQEYFFPVEEGDWIDSEEREWLAPNAATLTLRNSEVAIPDQSKLAEIDGKGAVGYPRHIANAMRALAETHREQMLARPAEYRRVVRDGFRELLMLDQWNHPNVVDGKSFPSRSATMQSLAAAMASDDASLYRPEPPNTHWSNWPDGGSL